MKKTKRRPDGEQNLNLSNFRDVADAQRCALELWKADWQAFQKSESTARALGDALNRVKKMCSHGGFKPWLEINRIDRNRASYCMRLSSGKVKKAKPAKTSTVPDGFKKLTILLTVAMHDRLALVAKAQGTELADYVSTVVMEHAVAQEKVANEIQAAIDSEDAARETAIREAEAANVSAEAKKKAAALLAISKKKVAAQERTAATTA